MTRPTLTALALVAVLCLMNGCSSFDARWNAARTDSKVTRWDGHWKSDKHHKSDGSPMGGRLRCILEPTDARMSANFRANWLIFASDYTMMLDPVRPGPTKSRAAARAYHGTHELPAMFGGTYQYDAQIAADHFTARYTSSYDHGIFTLQRVRLSTDCFPPHARD